MDELVTRLVRKGQPLTHIYAEHEAEPPVSLRSMYNYIDSGKMTIRNIDLRRKTGYKPRRKNSKDARAEVKALTDQSYRIGRSYEDFERNMKYFSEADVVEMDTVKGHREKGKRLLTMIFRKNSIMLMFLMPDGTAESVKRVWRKIRMRNNDRTPEGRTIRCFLFSFFPFSLPFSSYCSKIN